MTSARLLGEPCPTCPCPAVNRGVTPATSTRLPVGVANGRQSWDMEANDRKRQVLPTGLPGPPWQGLCSVDPQETPPDPPLAAGLLLFFTASVLISLPNTFVGKETPFHLLRAALFCDWP